MENINTSSKKDIQESKKRSGPKSLIQEKIIAGLFPSKEEIYQYYIIEGHTIIESRQHFNLTVKEWQKIVCAYGIRKQKESVYNNNTISFEEKIKKGVYPSKQEFQEEYIQKNRSQKEMCDLYGFSTRILNQLSRYYGLYKTKQQHADLTRRAIENKYGIDNVFRLSETKKKIQQTNLKKYQSKTFGESEIFRKQKGYTELGISILGDKDKLLDFLKQQNNPLTIYELSKLTNCEYSCLWNILKKWELLSYVSVQSATSHYEDEIEEFLKREFLNIKIIRNSRDILPSGKEIDIYLPDYKIGIEFNGDYWHCDLQEKFQDHGGRSTYHQEKSLEAEKQGIFLFHIFEHEWDERWALKNPKFINSYNNIINRIRSLLNQNQNKIPARQCEVREISVEEKRNFLQKNHIQGNDVTSNYYLGLFNKDNLVACMCFGSSKFKKYNYELTRYASISNTTVQGGASKLFKYFIDNKLQQGQNVVSYNDITKTRGDIYNILGFHCVSINDPNYWWVNFNTCEIRSRYQEQKAGEVERMHIQGFYRIADCGTKTWVYTKQ